MNIVNVKRESGYGFEKEQAGLNTVAKINEKDDQSTENCPVSVSSSQYKFTESLTRLINSFMKALLFFSRA